MDLSLAGSLSLSLSLSGCVCCAWEISGSLSLFAYSL